MKEGSRQNQTSSPEQTLAGILNKVAIIRHGAYGEDGMLNWKGIAQLESLGQRLKDTLTPEQLAIILSSDAKRAKHSSEILARILSAPVKHSPILFSKREGDQNYDAAYSLVNEIGKGFNLAVVVTHFEYVNGFPAYIMQREFGQVCPKMRFDTGEGVLIDLNSKSIQELYYLSNIY